jgi:hypothetical protein
MTDLKRSFARCAPLLSDFVVHEATLGLAALVMAAEKHGLAQLELPASVQAMFCFQSLVALIRLFARSVELEQPEPPPARVCTNPCCRAAKKPAAVRKQRRRRRRGRGW